MQVRSSWFVWTLALLFLIPVMPGANEPATSSGADSSGGPTVLVRILVPGGDASSLGADVAIVESYPGFVLARVPAAASERLQEQGFTVVPEDTYSLHVNGYGFDVRGDVRVPTPLAASPSLGIPEYYLVQFHGPVKESWKGALEALGPEVIGYVPNNAFVVRASTQEIAAANGLPQVQWTGPYHPAFRIAPDLVTAEGSVTTDIITFAEERVEGVVATLNKMGYRDIGRWSSGSGILSWGHYSDFGLVTARIDASALVPLARLNGVRYIQAHQEMRPENQYSQFVLQTNATVDGAGVRRLWDVGLHGEGQTIGIADTGLDYDHTMFRHSQNVITLGSGATSIYNQTNVARRKVVRYLPMSGFVGVDPFTGGDPGAIKDSPDGFCGNGHGTATAGAAAGDDTGITPTSLNDGMAPAAKLIEMDIGRVDAACSDALSYLPSDYNDLYSGAYANQARIFSNSWGGTSSNYDLGAVMVDRFVWNNPDAIMFYANGNNPPAPTVGSPATAKDDISVSGAAAWNNREAVSGGASRGPTTDGRRKPDITTIFLSGTGTAASDGDLTTLNAGMWSPGTFGGTSYATPLAAGMAALARQYFLEGWYPRGVKGGVALVPSAALMKALFAASSAQMTAACPGTDAFFPNIQQGWGRLWLDEGLYFPGDTKKLWVEDQRTGLQTGDVAEYHVRMNSGAGRLKVLLAWSDAPGLEGANPALVNNLDLEVTDPGGTVYRGNVRGSCAAGQSVTGGSFDVLNNLEGVIRGNPAVGDWKIRIIAANVPTGPQRFGLVVLGDIDRTWGTVELDKAVYNEADNVAVTVTDSDAATVTVSLTSNTEPAGETVTLTQPVPGGQIWRGSMPTNYGIPAADGKLQVSCGDTITATYNDISPAHASVATARVECDFPAISNVRVTGVTNVAATVTWTTDKASDSTVFYGTTIGLGLTAANPVLTTSHQVTLTGLTAATQYYFDVASTRTGHTTRDTNGGRHYAFKTAEKAEILLVVADSSFPVGRVLEYRNALASASWAANEWNIALQGDPPIAILRTYKAVLWESGLEQYPAFTDANAAMLHSYVDGGGRIMLGGHDIAWAACDPASSFTTPFRCNWVRSVLKGAYAADPQTFSSELGQAADPISGVYTGGAPYFPHRTGGAADEVNTLPAGGTTTVVWQTNSGGVPPNDGTKWLSSANNGSASPGCVWCGAPSRLVTNWFEFTGINFDARCDLNNLNFCGNPQRTDILNKTIVWLLGRNPPIVRVVSPNGGETIATNLLPVVWSRSQPLLTQEVWVSKDGGASWNKVKAVAPTNATDTIDISNVNAWPNGNQYLMRIVVNDTGSPTFLAQDDSNAAFTINRPGGDVQGPLVRPGSLRVSPNPAKNGRTLWINATIDDTLTGMSNIAAAEYFIQPTMPTVGQYGTGTPLNAVTGFNSPTEDVTITRATPEPAGTTLTIWVHGEDAATPTMNWGPFGGGNSSGGSVMILVIPSSAGVPPNPPTALNAQLQGATFADVHITWAAPVGGGAVDHYDVYFSSVYDATKTGYALLQGAIPAGQTSYDHLAAGSGNGNNYFYYVRAVNAGGGANSAGQAAKFTRALNGGWNLVSIPLTLADARITTVLQTMGWRTARTYAAGQPDAWKAYYVAKGNGDLRTVSTGMALWVDLINADDFTIAGQVPTSTTLTLAVGWNLVGYASFTVQAANVAFSGALGVTQIEVFSPAAQYYLQSVPMTTNLGAGNGYWVYSRNGGSWTVTN